jgi:catechol 2,3-dioxygenase-like lactoylglutathione lyase family enzyme
VSDAPTHVLDHLGVPVRDIAESRRFYEAALEPLGFGVVMELGDPPVLGIGLPRMPQLWLNEGEPGAPVHIALHAADRARVDAFHAAALAAGGRDNGAPGLRPHYHPSYYAAYALDPDGNNVEAVCHSPDSPSQ